MKLPIGTNVIWTSQSAGSWKIKTGIIVAHVPAKTTPIVYHDGVQLPNGSHPRWKGVYCSISSLHDRYAVAVPRGGKSVLVDYYLPWASVVDAQNFELVQEARSN
jgi:hypothetical protein